MIKPIVITTAILSSVFFLGDFFLNGESAFEKSPPISAQQVVNDTRHIMKCIEEYGSLNILVVDEISTRGVPNRVMLFSESNRCGSYKFKQSDEKMVTATVYSEIKRKGYLL
jgi:hypothetical protein